MNIVENDGLMEVESQLDDQQELSSTGDFAADSLRILEALLFASDELLSAARIKAILPDNPDARKIRKMVDKINVQLQKERHPFEIVEIGGGYQFRTVAYYHPWVRQIFKEKAAKKLSIQALECLAIIAYKQPVSKAEIEAVRGVVSDGAMKTLLEKKLVTISGRSDKPGKPLQYSTTHEFLKYFGLNKIEDLPRIEEFEAIAREKIDDLSFEELSNAQENETNIDTENQNAETEQQDIQSEDSQIPEPTAVFEIEKPVDYELLEKQNPSEEQLKPEEVKETSDAVSDSEAPTQTEKAQAAPEPTAAFEIHDFINEDDSEEEARQEPSDEKASVVAPEPTAVFEIHDFVDTLEDEASAEEDIDQTGNGFSDNCSSESTEKITDEKRMSSGSDQEMIEIETAEIQVDNNKEQSKRSAARNDESTDSNNSADSVEKKTGSGEGDQEETLEIILPEKPASNDENKEPGQQKKGFFSKIRKKK